jgi:hypothetical protein
MNEDLQCLKEGLMWLDIGLEKRKLLKSYNFEIFETGFVRRGKTESWALEFEHVRETPIPTLRAELARLPRR